MSPIRQGTADGSDSPRDAVVELRGVSKRFRAKRETLVAVDDVSLTVRPGTVLGLIGPDGAGKTTLLRMVAGLLRADSGEVRVLGRDMAHDPLPVQCDLGYMPQQFGLYTDLTVQENLDLYADLRGEPPSRRPARYAELMKMTGLEPFTGRLAGKLSGGMQQKLGLSCVLVRSPRVLLLDEPTAGVDPVSRRELWEIVRRLVENEGTGVILSTGYLDEAERCDEVAVFNEGRVLGRGTPKELTSPLEGSVYALSVDEDGDAPRDLQAMFAKRPGVLDAAVEAGRVRVVLDPDESPDPASIISDMPHARFNKVAPRLEDAFVYLLRAHTNADSAAETARSKASPGRSVEERPDQPPANGNTSEEPIIAVHELKRRFGSFYAVKGLDFEVAPGEVFGLLGANGAGKSTTFRMLCGLLPASSGNLRVAGVDMRKAAPRARARIGYMSQKFSLYGNLSVLENLRFFGSAYGLFGKRRRTRLEWALREFHLDAWKTRPSGTLPLGYKQRLALAAALIHEPRILFLDEPTSGVDPLARREFWRRISEQAARGVTVMVTTHFMEEAEYCDRLAIMLSGEILTVGSPSEIRRKARSEARKEPTMEDAFIHLIEAHQKSPGEDAS